ncbi:MAG: dTMP kinase [Chloroflexi bacterium]|nr:dTMP kinase [Chloroflexota bacterium]
MPTTRPSVTNSCSQGFFITFEGPEGCGKTTQTQVLAQRLRELGHVVTLTREPGGTVLGERVRQLLLHAIDVPLAPRAEALLFAASRAQFVEEAIRPPLAAGEVVLCDRYADSTLAYQGYGRDLDRRALREVLDFATGGLTPDLTLLLDLPAEEGLRRKLQALVPGEMPNWDRFEQQDMDFHRRVREGYRQLAAAGGRWVVVDATQPVPDVERYIWQVVTQALGNSKRIMIPVEPQTNCGWV